MLNNNDASSKNDALTKNHGNEESNNKNESPQMYYGSPTDDKDDAHEVILFETFGTDLGQNLPHSV